MNRKWRPESPPRGGLFSWLLRVGEGEQDPLPEPAEVVVAVRQLLDGFDLVVEPLRDPVAEVLARLVPREARGDLHPPVPLAPTDRLQELGRAVLQPLRDPLHERGGLGEGAVLPVGEEFLEDVVAVPEVLGRPHASEEHVVVVLGLARPVGDHLVGDLGAAAEEEPPSRLHERVLRAALLEGVHRVDPELPDRVGQQGDHVEEVHDVDRLGEIDPFDRGVGVAHVGDEIADPVELLPPF